MRILICTIGERREATSADENSKRLAALTKLLDMAVKAPRGVDLVVLPGGYFFAAQENPKRMPVLREIWAAIKKRRIAVCFGVNTAKKRTHDDEAVRKRRIPVHGFAWTPKDGCVGPWRQRSTNRENQKDADEGSVGEERYIHVGTHRVALLMCGELFSPRIRAAVAAQGVTVVVDMVHGGKGFRFHGAAKRWSSAGPIRAALMSCHAERERAMKRWSIAGKYLSSRDASIIVPAPVRIEGFVVSVP